MKVCTRPKCRTVTGHVSGYCSDLCLQLDQDFDSPPVTVLARNKSGGFGRGLAWQARIPVPIPDAT